MRTFLALLLLALAAPSAAELDLTLGWSETRGRGAEGRDGGGAWLNLRHQFGVKHGIELDFNRSAFADGDRSAWSLHWVETNPEPLWRPFFLLGLGHSDGPGGSGALASVGIGGRWSLIPGHLDLRADLRYRHDRAAPQGARNEGVLLIGLGLPLRGGR
jgi:hypothetical protein